MGELINFPALIDRPQRVRDEDRIIGEAFGREAIIMILPIVRIERPEPAPTKPGKRRRKAGRLRART